MPTLSQPSSEPRESRGRAALGLWLHALVALAIGVLRTLRGAGHQLHAAVHSASRGEPRTAVSRLARAASATLLAPVDALLLFAGSSVALVQTLAGLEPVGRRLTAAEEATLRRVFAGALDLAAIRVKHGAAGLLTLPGRAFVLADTIYVPPRTRLTAPLLVHEATHVWQHQRLGTGYLSAALLAQHLGAGYDYLPAVRRGRPWSQLNPEQQAQLLEDAFAAGCVDCAAPFRVAGEDLSPALAAALATVRGGRQEIHPGGGPERIS